MSFADTGVGGQGPLKVWGYTKFGLGQPRYTMVLFRGRCEETTIRCELKSGCASPSSSTTRRINTSSHKLERPLFWGGGDEETRSRLGNILLGVRAE